ncbi:MAG: FAD:protein FMN transferase, partial [Bdellovibrionales bacterium]|nr:FAD:protein FMN transferase [Bdellovibrionales bacterium]
KICLVIQAHQQAQAREDIALAFKEIGRINSWMSDWLPETELSQVNQFAGEKPVKVGSELLGVLSDTLSVARDSAGALDPSFNVMWGTYNFKKGAEREATEEEIKTRLPLIDWRKVIVDSEMSTVFLKEKGMKIGLGAVGQSYAADRTVEILKKKKYVGGYVDGSGDTVFWGHKPGGAKWTTGVRDPSNSDAVLVRIYGTDFAITTCGDDEKYFFRDGRRVHHVLDPKTGRPAMKSRQVTVIAKRGFTADAWDTAAFVLGSELAIPILEKKGLRAVFVEPDGTVKLTKGLKKESSAWGEGYVVTGALN